MESNSHVLEETVFGPLHEQVCAVLKEAMTRVISEENLGNREPSFGWDGDYTQASIFEVHENETVFADTLVLIREEEGVTRQWISLEFTTRVYSVENRQASATGKFHQMMVNNTEEIPSVEEFVRLLKEGVRLARETVPKLPQIARDREELYRQIESGELFPRL